MTCRPQLLLERPGPGPGPATGHVPGPPAPSQPRWRCGLLAGLVALLLASSASASDPPTDVWAIVERLSDVIPTDERRELEGILGDSSVPVAVDVLEALLEVEVAQRSAVRILQQRADPETVELLFRAFVRSRRGSWTMDPDIFERALRTLQQLPRDEVREAMISEGTSAFVAAARDGLDETWLQPLREGGAPEITLDDRSQLEAAMLAHDWLSEALAPGGPGLVALQVDSGDGFWRLLGAMRGALLAGVLARRPLDEAVVAAEAASQSGWSPEARSALLARLEREPAPELAVYRDARLASYPQGGAYPVAPLDVPPSDRDWRTVQPARSVGGAVAWGVLLLFGVALVLVARSERLRPLVFRLAAVAVGVGVVVAVEGVLALAGVRPPIEVQPAFNPHRVQPRLLERIEIDGQPHLRTAGSPFGTRALVLPVARPEGELRVVTLGESSVHGSQYLEEETFSAVLERRLQGSFGDFRIRVVNGGVGGATSDSIVQYSLDLLEADPDLAVLYFGNNDLKALGNLASYRSWSPRSMAARIAVDRIRLSRLLRPVLPTPDPDEGSPGEGLLDSHDPSPSELARLATLASLNLRSNMVTIARSFRRRGVPVLVVLQAMNDEICPPDYIDELTTSPACFAPRLRAIALEVGARTGAPVIDAAAALRADAKRRFGTDLAGGPYFYDSCHPTRLGHAVIGEAIAPAATELLRERLR